LNWLFKIVVSFTEFSALLYRKQQSYNPISGRVFVKTAPCGLDEGRVTRINNNARDSTEGAELLVEIGGSERGRLND
jgi:hypothetical protein